MIFNFVVNTNAQSFQKYLKANTYLKLEKIDIRTREADFESYRLGELIVGKPRTVEVSDSLQYFIPYYRHSPEDPDTIEETDLFRFNIVEITKKRIRIRAKRGIPEGDSLFEFLISEMLKDYKDLLEDIQGLLKEFNFNSSKLEEEEPLDSEGKLWYRIPDIGWDRIALKLWLNDYTHREIGLKLDFAPKTIQNRLTVLRKLHGTEVVPLRRRRKKGY